MPETADESALFRCPNCDKDRYNTPSNILRNKNKPTFGWCQNCAAQTLELRKQRSLKLTGRKGEPKTDEMKMHLSGKMKTKWEDPVYDMKQKQIEEQWADEDFKKRHFIASMAVQDQRVINMKAHHSTPEFKASQAEISNRLWQNPIYKTNALAHITDEYKQTVSTRMKLQRNTPEWHLKLSETARNLWLTPEYRLKSTLSDEEIKKTLKGKFEYLGRSTGCYIFIKCLKCGHEGERRPDKWHQQCGACYDRNKSSGEEEVKDAPDNLVKYLLDHKSTSIMTYRFSDYSDEQWEQELEHFMKNYKPA